ncbi:hypothetical protein DBR37_07910 [Herminiimonas sp. KBW02]|nr:hypothetical protein DBR37_07910 [Herminiimonas sp. KBW02]
MLILMPIGVIVFSVILAKSILHKEWIRRIEYIKRYLPFVGIICVVPSLVFTALLLHAIFFSKSEIEYFHFHYMNVLLFSCLVSTIIFLLWCVQVKMERVISDKIYIIWFANTALFTYPISVYMLLKMIVNFLSGELLLA